VTKTIFLALTILFCFVVSSCDSRQDNVNEANQYLKSADQLFNQGQLRAALVQAKNVIQMSPDSAQGYLQIARIYNRIGYYSEVEKLIGNKTALMPELSYELAYAYFQRKKYRSALDTLTISSVEQDQAFRLLKSQCHLYLGETTEYEMEIHKIAAVSNDDGYLSFAQAKSAQLNADWINSEKLFSSISSSSGLYLESLVNLADVYVHQSKFDAAEKSLTTALSSSLNADTLTVEKANILSRLVQILVQQGRSGEAYTYQAILAAANPQLDAMKNRFDEAVALYAEGEIGKSQILLTELHRSYPNNSNVTTLLGVIAFQQGRDQEAEELFAKVIDPETATPGLIQASSLLKARNNKIDEAIELLKSAINAQPENAQLLATYGLALLQKEPADKNGAMALEKSIAMDPAQQRLRLALAERHYRLGETVQGLAQLETAFKNAPLDRIVEQTYFSQLARDQNENKVLSSIAELKNKYPDEYQVSLIESWWMIKQGQYPAAEKLLTEKFSSLTPAQKMDSLLLLSDLYLKQNKHDSARKMLQDYLRLSPEAMQIYLRWFDLLEKNTLQSAKDFLKELQGADETLWQPHFYTALLNARNHQWSEVESSLDFVLQKTSDPEIKRKIISIYNNYGFQLFQSGKLAEAQKIFIKSLGLDLNDRTALYYYVQIALKSGQVAQAKTLLQSPEADKKSAIYLFLTGLIEEKEQKSAEALLHFQEAWKMDAFELYAEKLYEIYQTNKDYSSLNRLIEEWNQRAPENPKALLLKAMLQQEQTKSAEAITSYEKLLALQPNNLVAMNNLAWLYADVNPVKAEELAAVAYKMAPDSVDIVDTYVGVLLKNNQPARADEILQKAISLYPDNKMLQEKMEILKKSKNKR
jgi:tetratricopeptide (TPR) repeat protein